MSPPNAEIQSFPSLPPDFKAAADLVQTQFKEGIQSLDARVGVLQREHAKRKATAIVLKIVSVLSSLVIATGFVGAGLVQVLGGSITAIAALERILANTSRLLAVAAATAAYERVRMQVVALHNKRIVEVVKIREREPEKSADSLIQFVGDLRDRLAQIGETVETDLAANAYENLGRLSLEEQKPIE